jgi:hypothetical protein
MRTPEGLERYYVVVLEALGGADGRGEEYTGIARNILELVHM